MNRIVASKTPVTGDIPPSRFGHTFTMVSKDKAVLFGGAVSISGTVNYIKGKFVITNETYLFDFTQMRWKKLNFKQGFVPSERAAHAAVMVSEMQMIIYGGAASGNQGLLKDQLYILDLRKYKPYLVVFGGNSGNKAENDVWLLNITKGPFSWSRYQFPRDAPQPCPRVYHSAAICEQGSALGMMVVFGGRRETKKQHNSSQQQNSVAALNDIWGLRKHRDGSWDWVTPPKSESYTPIYRYQHLVTFMGSCLVIVGGRSNLPQEVVQTIQIYDTQTSEWSRFNSLSRYRHAIALYDRTKLFVHGGFEPEMTSQPLQTMSCIDLRAAFQPQQNQHDFPKKIQSSNSQFKENMDPMSQRCPTNRKQLREINESQRNMPLSSQASSRARHNEKMNRSRLERGERDLTPSRIINSSKSIRLSSQVVVAQVSDHNQSQIQIQKKRVNELMEESKKLTAVQNDCEKAEDLSMLDLVDSVISILMPTGVNSRNLKNFTLFPFKRDKIIRLAQETINLLSQETTLIGVRSPSKIFGSLYGRYQDLLNIFDNFGYPDEKEMETFEYVFLGNYVGKGFNSLETICLLMALKIKYPDHIRLLRGRLEDTQINRICGFAEECSIRLGENINEPSSIFHLINSVFEYMPLVAAIEDQYLCMNGNLGQFRDLVSIKEMARPMKVKGNFKVVSMLWSNINSKAVQQIGYGPIERCSENQLEQFLDQNGLEMIINCKDGLKMGCEEDGLCLSLNTIANYANSNSKSCILKITKDLQIMPCIANSNGVKSTPWVTELSTKINIGMTEDEVNFRRAMFSN